MNQELISIFEKELNSKAYPTNKGNYAFYSPFINHRKRKLEIEFDINNRYFGQWHCWVSDNKGKTFFTLLDKINASKSSIDRVTEILKETKYRRPIFKETPDEEKQYVDLPKEFKPLSRPSRFPEYKNALYYIKNVRGLTDYDILKYNIGYCEEGKYKDYIIIPSYDENGNLNYFVTRAYYDTEYKHRNPSLERNIIGFENLINWTQPVVLVEGAFDAMSAKLNVIPLFGKVVLDALKIKIIKNKVSDIYIGLDTDAIRNSLKISEYFMSNGVDVYLMMLGDKDPNEMGYNKFREIMRNTDKLTFSKILRYKLDYGIRK